MLQHLKIAKIMLLNACKSNLPIAWCILPTDLDDELLKEKERRWDPACWWPRSFPLTDAISPFANMPISNND
jgi:hypothetical protein